MNMQYKGCGYCGPGSGETLREKRIRQQRDYRKYLNHKLRIRKKGQR